MDKRRIGVRAVVVKNNKVLAVKHRRKDGTEASFWALPGGGLDPGEGIRDGVAREILEETGIPPQLGNLLFVQQFTSTRNDSDEELEFFFHVTNADDYVAVDLSKTSHGVEEIARIEFIDPSSERILPKFISDVNLAEQIATPQPVRMFTYLHKT